MLIKKEGIRRLLGGATINARAIERIGELVLAELGRLLKTAENEAQTRGRRRISSSDIEIAWDKLHKGEEGYET